MLVCTQCGFENPNSNNFCQECGASLTDKTCPACCSPVSFSSLHCQACGTETGVTWLAIVTLPATDAQLQAIAYLDQQQRYQLMDPFVPGLPLQEITVLDTQPLEPAPLDTLSEAELDRFMAGGPLEAPRGGGSADDHAQTEPSAERPEVSLPIPEIVRPYLALRSQFHETFPALHDAWQAPSGQAVILLQERSHLLPLFEIFEGQERPSFKDILSYLLELLDLWDALTPWNCRQSLLDLDNLRIDENAYLCLQRLYDDEAAPPTLADLGHLWKTLLIQPAIDVPKELATLITDVAAAGLATTDEMRSRLIEIAPIVDPTPMPPLLPESPGESGEADAPSSGMTISVAELAMAMDNDNDNDSDGDELPTIVLPMQLFSLDDVGRSDTGRQREHNEDFYGIDIQISKQEGPKGTTLSARNLYILCDGMGGHDRGEVASRVAVTTLVQYFKDKWQNYRPDEAQGQLPNKTEVIEAVQLANKVLYDENQQDDRSGNGRMGTTLVLMLVQNTRVAIAHVGDSRLYRFTRKRGLEQITVDHEVGQREIQRGVEADIAYARNDAYQLTQALGPRDEYFIKPDVQYLDISEDSLFLLCSDGMSDNDLLEKHCASHIEPLLSSQTNLDVGVSKLMELANEYNGHDNITTIVVRAKVRPDLSHLR
jgi:protein phosphatase